MKILLHDNQPQHLGEPITAAIIAVTAAIIAIDKMIKQTYGSWAGLNGEILRLFGKHPSTDKKKVDALRNKVHNNTKYKSVRVWRERKTANLNDLIWGAEVWKKNVLGARKGADSGDWVAARYLIVYSEILEDVAIELQRRLDLLEKENPAAVQEEKETQTATGSDFEASTGGTMDTALINKIFGKRYPEITTRPAKNSTLAKLAAGLLILTQL